MLQYFFTNLLKANWSFTLQTYLRGDAQHFGPTVDIYSAPKTLLDPTIMKRPNLEEYNLLRHF